MTPNRLTTTRGLSLLASLVLAITMLPSLASAYSLHSNYALSFERNENIPDAPRFTLNITFKGSELPIPDRAYSSVNTGAADEPSAAAALTSAVNQWQVIEKLFGNLPDDFHEPVLTTNPGTTLVDQPTVSAPVPEPGAALLFGIGLLTVASKPRRMANK